MVVKCQFLNLRAKLGLQMPNLQLSFSRPSCPCDVIPNQFASQIFVDALPPACLWSTANRCFSGQSQAFMLFLFLYSVYNNKAVLPVGASWSLCNIYMKTVPKVQTSSPGFDFEVLELFSSLYIFGTIKLINGNRGAIPLTSHSHSLFQKHIDAIQILKKAFLAN